MLSDFNNGILIQFGSIASKKSNTEIILTLSYNNSRYIVAWAADDMENSVQSAGYGNIYNKTVSSFWLRCINSGGNTPDPDYRTYISIGY